MGRKPNIECSECQNPIYRKPSRIREYNYCSECRTIANSRAAEKKRDKDYQEYIEGWLAGKKDGMRGKTSISSHIRKWLFKQYGSECSRCGWHEVNPTTGKTPLAVEHIDGNFRNNRPDNLTLLCPNCHSLTSTYKSLNMGNGRPRCGKLAESG